MGGFRSVTLIVVLASCGKSSDHAATDGGVGADASIPSGAYCPSGANATPVGGAEVTLDIDLGTGPLQQAFTGPATQVAAPLAVSDYIYGINQYPENNYFLNYAKTQWGMMRWGGDSYSAWNWTNNDENNGRDNGFTNTDQFLPFAYGSVATDPAYHGDAHDTNPLGAVVDGSDSIAVAQGRYMASLLTISVQDYVAANASEAAVTYAPSADFVTNKPVMAAGGGQVYQDQYVAVVTTDWGMGPVFYSLDNEPNYWSGTHPEVFGTNDLSFDELVSRDSTFAAAIKSQAPDSLVFGPVVAGLDGMTSLDDYNDQSMNPYTMTGTDAIEYYLAHLQTASTTAGKRLLDVLDLHYYNDSKDKNGTAKTADDCAQGPRDFWDPTYQTVDTSYDDFITGWKPRTLIPRLDTKIAANYPGTKLAFTEYNNGCETEVAGGVAQADTLGVFGQYGVFAATVWPLESVAVGTNWLVGAFGAYRNYDGNGAIVGSLATGATSSDPTKVSVYAFVRPNGATGVEVVAINRTDAAVTTELRLSNACTLGTATGYQLTSANAAMMSVGAPTTIASNAFAYTLPAMSVTTFALR